MKLLSIAIPCYNSEAYMEKYIARCVILKYRIVTLHEEENK